MIKGLNDIRVHTGKSSLGQTLLAVSWDAINQMKQMVKFVNVTIVIPK